MNKKKIVRLIATASTIAGGLAFSNKQVSAVEHKTTNNNNHTTNTANVAQGTKGKITNVSTNLRVRADAGTSYEILGYLSNGANVTIKAEKGNWYVIDFKGKEGFVSKDYVSIEESTPSNSNVTVSSTGKVVNVTHTLNIRQSASTTSAVIGSLRNGESVGIISKSGNWYNIKNGATIGFVSSDYLEETSNSEKAQVQNVSVTKAIEKGKVVNITSNLRVRKEASTSSAIVGYLVNGQEVTIKAESGNWYGIDFKGSIAYVSKDYIQKGGSSNSSTSTGNNSGSTNSNTNASVAEGKVVNISSSLNVRSQVGGPVIGSLRNGQTVSIIGESGNWYEINYNGRTGYVSKDYIQKGGSSNSSASTGNNSGNTNSNTNTSSNNAGSSNLNQTMNKQGQVYNVSSNLRVRSGASSSATVLGYLTNGQVVTITGKSGNWYKINFNGKEGYVSSDYIRDYSGSNPVTNLGTTTNGNVSNSNAYNNILNAMKVHIGTPYVWGGSGELLTTNSLNVLKKRFPTHDYSRAEAYVNKGYRAFDCSGLMQWGFAQAGIKIGRTTWDQINNGKEVSLNDLKPGDLLFYSNLQHVGMYIGNGQWIEAPNSSANIRIVSVPWSKIGRARRILN